MSCEACGSALPDGAVFCPRCGSRTPAQRDNPAPSSGKGVIAGPTVTSLKCPSCGAPIAPRFGEMLIACEYCGNSVTLGSEGWKNIQKHTMLPLKVTDREAVVSTIHAVMNRGILRWHVWERSTLQELTLSYVPYWILSVSARTSILAVDTTTQVASLAAAAAIAGAAGSHHGRHGSGADALILGSMMSGSLGGGGTAVKAFQMSENHNYPVVALKALAEYQPHDFEFALHERQLFDVSKIPKGIKVLNGDVGEQDAKQQARALVDQLQSKKAHEKYSMIRQLTTEIEVGDAELLHVPAWLGRYRFKREKTIVVIVDGNSGMPIHTVGIDD